MFEVTPARLMLLSDVPDALTIEDRTPISGANHSASASYLQGYTSTLRFEVVMKVKLYS